MPKHGLLLIGYLLFVAIAAANAQQPTQPSGKDRKDYLLESVESQRNDALAKLALCYADGNGQIDKVNAGLSDTNKTLAAVTKERDDAKAQVESVSRQLADTQAALAVVKAELVKQTDAPQ